MEPGPVVAVFGAYGHTGRLVTAELRDRGYVPVLVGRDGRRPQALGTPDLALRTASTDAPSSLDRALEGTAAVVDCAGPFAVTAVPVVEAALRAGIPYVDVAAEIEANLDTFARFTDRARAAGVAVVPAMAFFGALGDLLAVTATGDWKRADEVHVAYGLSGRHPTAGTRIAGRVSQQRRGGRRVLHTGGRMEYLYGPRSLLEWTFPDPMGTRAVVGGFTMAESVTIPRHLAVPEVRAHMTVEAAEELSAPDTPPPAPADERGRSAQTFVVDVVVRAGGRDRRASARGRDIYAVTAPLVVEAVHRILTGRVKTTGAASAGEIFDAPAFLRALSAHIALGSHRDGVSTRAGKSSTGAG